MSRDGLSVVIRCRNDPSVLDCIHSIDTDAEIIVAYTGSPSLEGQIKECGAKSIPAPFGNLSKVSNAGFQAASCDKIVFTDSDTRFGPGCLGKLTVALEDYKIARAKLLFHDTQPPTQRMIANARDYVNRLPLTYTPGLAVRRDLLPEIGGFLFNDIVPFAVDADLNFRVVKAGAKTAFVSDAWLQHGSISLRHDIRAAYRIGDGCACSIDYWNNLGTYGHLGNFTLKGVPPSLLPDLLRSKGIATLAYQLFWDAAYWLGFLRRKSSP